MTVQPLMQVLVKCTQCFRVVQLRGVEQIDEDGDRYVDAAPIYKAMALHMAHGCIARRRRG